MTTVNRHSISHSGLLVTGTGDDLDVELEVIGGRTLRLSAAGEEIGAWPIDECHIEPDASRGDAFRLLVDGDTAVFTPTDPIGFRTFADRLAPASRTVDGIEAAVGPVAATEPDPASSVVDDPVAFLFGSSSPPPAPEPTARLHPDPDFDPLRGQPTEPEPTDDVDPLGPDGAKPIAESPDDTATSPEVSDEQPGIDDVDLGDDGLVEDVAGETDDPPLSTPRVVDVMVDPLGETEPGAEVDDSVAEELASPPDAGRARFGRGSALDRLSEAISSLKPGDDGEEYELGPNTVAEDVIVTQRTLRDKRLKEVARGKQLKTAAAVVSVVGVIALLALLAPQAIDFVRNYEGGAELPPTLPVTETTVVVTTTIPEATGDTVEPATTVPGDATADVGSVGGTIFDRPAPEFVAVWNAVGDPVSAVLRFETNPLLGPFEQQFTPYLGFIGEVEPDGTLAGFSLVVDPTGPAEHDRLGMQALGVAIATVDPSRSPAGRASLLLDLGLNVRQPMLEGIDGTATINGILYRLVYDPESILLTFTVTPAG
jgi:hypothetical protein